MSINNESFWLGMREATQRERHLKRLCHPHLFEVLSGFCREAEEGFLENRIITHKCTREKSKCHAFSSERQSPPIARSQSFIIESTDFLIPPTIPFTRFSSRVGMGKFDAKHFTEHENLLRISSHFCYITHSMSPLKNHVRESGGLFPREHSQHCVGSRERRSEKKTLLHVWQKAWA